MKLSVCKFRRRWVAMQELKDPRQRASKIAHLVTMAGAEPLVITQGRDPVAYRLPGGEIFCIKKSYASYDAAAETLAVLQQNPERDEVSIYPCRTCGAFHLSSKPNHHILRMPWERAEAMLAVEAYRAKHPAVAAVWQ